MDIPNRLGQLLQSLSLGTYHSLREIFECIVLRRIQELGHRHGRRNGRVHFNRNMYMVR